MAKTIDKKQSMEELDAKIQKVFLNFTVSRKKVEEYTLCEPFIHLERLETMKVSDGAGSMPPLELFDCIVKEYDLLVLWNTEVSKLLNQEISEEVQNVTY